MCPSVFYTGGLFIENIKMSSKFRYPFVTPILYDLHIEDEAFAELKELFIEIISRPVYISNLNFVSEMKHNYAVYVEDFANYKKLYSYMVGQATKMYYQLCENNFNNIDSPDYELHPNYCWFFVALPGDFAPHHRHANRGEKLFHKGAPNYECNGTIYLNTFDVEKEFLYHAEAYNMRQFVYNVEVSDLENMSQYGSDTQRGQIQVDTPAGNAGMTNILMFPKAQTGFVIGAETNHQTYPHASDQLRISFVYNNALLVAPGPTEARYKTIWHAPMRLDANKSHETPTYKLPEELIEECKKTINYQPSHSETKNV
jgi:hypothetical protein